MLSTSMLVSQSVLGLPKKLSKTKGIVDILTELDSFGHPGEA